MWKLNNAFLNNQWVKDKITREIENTLRQMKKKTQYTKTYGIQLKQCYKEKKYMKSIVYPSTLMYILYIFPIYH